MASRAGDLRMNLNRMNMLGRSLHRIGDLDPFRDGEDQPQGEEGPESAPDAEAEGGDEEGEEAGGDESTTPANPYRDNPHGDPDGTEDGGDDTEQEVRIPTPPAGRGNPMRPGQMPQQKINIIRTRGVY